MNLVNENLFGAGSLLFLNVSFVALLAPPSSTGGF